jgi:fructose-1-phosphate kinase PfkB-like protein
MECAPFLIKPNEEEIVAYTKTEISLPSDAIKAAKLIRGNGVENVMISLGSQGAMLVCDDGAFVATPPRIDALSTIGAGDSSIGGFLAAMANGLDAEACLQTAVAFGSAACLTRGTRPPKKEDILRLLQE